MPSSSDRNAAAVVTAKPPYYSEADASHKPNNLPWDATQSQTRYWDDLTPGATYEPYIIKVVSLKEPILSFQFQTETGWTTGKPFEIDLTDARLVWRHLPSTLKRRDGTSIGPDQAGFLFLTSELESYSPEMWSAGHVPRPGSAPAASLAGAGTGGGGKWPKGSAGELLQVVELMSRLSSTDLAVLAGLLSKLETLMTPVASEA